MNVSISLCPTDLEVGSEGDWLEPDVLLDRMRSWLLTKYPEAKIYLQVGYHQGDRWARAWDSTLISYRPRQESEELGADLLEEFFAKHLSDPDLYTYRPQEPNDET